MPGIPTQAASPLNTRDLVNLINRFTFKLQRQEAGVPISGLNVYACLLGAAYGFEGKTLDEFLKVLGTESVDIRSALSSLKGIRALLKEGGNFQDANSIWYRHSLSLDPQFSRVQEEEHDFKSGPINAEAISTFVRDNTNGLIDFSPDIKPDTVLLLVSCLYFKGLWESPFDPGRTSSSTFETFARDLIPCDMMQAHDVYQYQDTRHYQALLLPYKRPNPSSPQWSAIFLLPKTRLWGKPSRATLFDIISSLTINERQWTQFTQSFAPKDLTIYIPRFEMRSNRNLLPVLRSLGLKHAARSSADYWATYPRTEVFIDSISHMTTLKCGEQGTEVAAATICEQRDSIQTLEFVANRPFWFAILDQVCGVVIYSGVIDNVAQF